MPATLSILTNVFRDEKEREIAIAIWSAVIGVAVALGPIIGGALVEHFWWGSVFLVNVPICVVVIAAAFFLVPTSKTPSKPPIDYVGAVMSMVGLVAILYAVIQGPDQGWTSLWIVGPFVGGIAVLVLFVFWERRCEQPMLDVGLFTNMRFTAANLSLTLVFFGLMGAMYLATQYFQNVLGYSPFDAGLATLPVSVGLTVFAIPSAPLDQRFGTKAIVTAGFVAVAGSFVMATQWHVDTPYWFVGITLAVMGMGMGIAMTPATNSVMGSVPVEKAGMGSAMNDTTREIGGAIGIAVMGSMLSSQYTSTLQADIAALPAETRSQISEQVREAIESSIAGAIEVAESVGGADGDRIREGASAAFVSGQDLAMWVAVGASVLGAAVALIWLPARSQPKPGETGSGASDDTRTTRLDAIKAEIEGLGELGAADFERPRYLGGWDTTKTRIARHAPRVR